MSGATIFGASLEGAGNAPLRRRLRQLAAGRKGAGLRVDAVLALAADLDRRPPEAAPAPYLLLDLHHVYFYQESAGEDGVRIDSVIRFLVDGYPDQPFELLAKHFAERRFRFLYDPEILEILPALWSRCRPGTLIACDLVKGEIEWSRPAIHPTSEPAVRLEPEEAAEPPPLTLHRRDTDASLRLGRQIDLDGLVSRPAGIVRQLSRATDFASLPFASSMVMWNQGRKQEFCHGKSFRASEASTVALCEALERFQVAFHPLGEELVYGSYAELGERAVDPRRLFFGRCSACPEDSLPPYDDQDAMYWTWAAPATGGAPLLVPAQEVWFNACRLPDDRRFIRATTNACALGGCFEEAAIFALLEAIERDAFMIMWYLRRPCRRIDPSSIASEPFQLLRQRIQRAFVDYDFLLYDVTADTRVPTVAAMAVRREGDGPMSFHAAASRLSAESACLAALKDLTGFRPFIAEEKRGEIARLLDEPERIHGPAGHFDLYALEESFSRLDFLELGKGPLLDVRELDRSSPVPPRQSYELRGLLERLLAHLADLGIPVLFRDMSHPEIARRGLRCVKAVAPGLHPVWFGSRNRRFEVTDRLRRLAERTTGRTLGDAGDCNLEVHPLA